MPTFALPPLERDAEHNARLGEGGLSLHLLDDDAWLLQGEAGSVEFGVDVPPPLLAPAGSDAAASAAAVALPPAGAAAPPQDGGPSTPTQGAEALRCLDYTHGAGCSRCVRSAGLRHRAVPTS